VAVSCVRDPDPITFEEDLLATACATYAVLLGAHARGLAAYWRTPAVLRSDAGKAALRIPPEEHTIGLLHLGPARQEPRVPERVPAADVISWLD
jgi:nitroreductase